MRELVKSILRFSWATSLFGVRQLTTGLPMGPGGTFSRRGARVSKRG
jgi:hypothetical protein